MTNNNVTSILSLDIGRKRIGLAGCDPLGITITTLQPIYRSKFKEDIKTIKYHCQYRNVKGLVIGIPLDDLGKQTKQAIYCERYGTRVAKEMDLPLAWVNEHSSTWAAGDKNNLHGDKTGRLDSEAAALLLEQWLREGPELLPAHMATYKACKLN